MIYFHDAYCISPQPIDAKANMSGAIRESEKNQLVAAEPAYPDIPNSRLRRMGKALRMGVGASLPILKKRPNMAGIILGTANGGMEDCIKFLNQVIEFDEGTLTPTNFVQSTTNAVAGQIGLLNQNTGYNATHVHRGLSFENALADAMFLLAENPNNQYLVGGLDEISKYNYNIDRLAGWFKSDFVSSLELYKSITPGSLAGEGVAMYAVSGIPKGAKMKLSKILTFHTQDKSMIENAVIELARTYELDAWISGENGDVRFNEWYEMVGGILSEIPTFPYKHLCGEYPTSSAFALFLFWQIATNKKNPLSSSGLDESKTILIYNNYHGLQHSLMVIEKVD
jgi:hypothetical protein